jgi:outer membrane protein assembly factor BamB
VGGPYIPSPVIVGPNLYVLLDRGFLTCFNAATGESVYGKNRLGRRSQFTASPVAGDGKIYCLSEDGTCYVVQAGSAFKLIAANELDEICMASPAVADGRLFIRARKNLYCIGP